MRDGTPDVLLDVPPLHVDEIDLELDDLSAQVSLAVQLLDLLKLDVGADARLGRVRLTIKGLDAQAQLQVRLDNVARIVDRTMATLDHNPQLVENLAAGLQTALGEVGSGAQHVAGELAQDVGAVSRTVAGARGEDGAPPTPDGQERTHVARPREAGAERRVPRR